jgi:hypothetical protein
MQRVQQNTETLRKERPLKNLRKAVMQNPRHLPINQSVMPIKWMVIGGGRDEEFTF